MSNAPLAIVAFAILVLHAWSSRSWNLERKRLVDAILSKNVPEFMSMQREPRAVTIEKKQPTNIFPEGL